MREAQHIGSARSSSCIPPCYYLKCQRMLWMLRIQASSVLPDPHAACAACRTSMAPSSPCRSLPKQSQPTKTCLTGAQQAPLCPGHQILGHSWWHGTCRPTRAWHRCCCLRGLRTACSGCMSWTKGGSWWQAQTSGRWVVDVHASLSATLPDASCTLLLPGAWLWFRFHANCICLSSIAIAASSKVQHASGGMVAPVWGVDLAKGTCQVSNASPAH
jgi:hypothetical protein